MGVSQGPVWKSEENTQNEIMAFSNSSGITCIIKNLWISHIQMKAISRLSSCGGRLCAAAAADSLSWRFDAAAQQTPASSCDAPNYSLHN